MKTTTEETTDKKKRVDFPQLYLDHHQRMHTYASRILFDHEASEDVVHEVFTDLWDRLEELNVDNWNAYLLRATKFKSLNYLRSKHETIDELEVFEKMGITNGAEEKIAYQDTEKAFREALERIPCRCREVFLLSRDEELSYNEISAKLGISIQTVKNQVSKALGVIREALPA
ncbi:RNA polymerase sigma-70 factor (plasmid) [Fulvitalea axinellae]|uniref:RNA polymerase sigma-70 factor n=1 Tax=Fulvitalea axinellae TaxID=1182444 RepID=A0AAU9CPE1_9BACT|nr:RNA polymerase sigma-70 factor [Fulvitalea axinellae]